MTIGGDRPTTLFVPEVDGPMPLLMLLHAYGYAGQRQEDYWRLGLAAASRGVAYLHPDGTMDGRGHRFWNATDACCNLDKAVVDDSAYLHGLIGEAKSVAKVDPRRVYVVGHSNGGFMSYRMACEHADEVAAIASFGAGTFATTTDCRPSEPVAILHIHGTADQTIWYGGGEFPVSASPVPVIPEPRTRSTSDAFVRYPGAVESTETWAAYDGCAAGLIKSDRRVDVVASSDGPDGPEETTVTASSDCDPGGHVELWTISDGEHFPELSISFAESVIEFLLAHPKP